VQPDPPLVRQARAFLRQWSERRDGEQNLAYRAHALALADTLERAGEFVLASRALEQAGILFYRSMEIDPALKAFDRGLDLARRSGDGVRIASMLNAKASGVSAAGDNAKALALQRELLALRRELGDARGEAITWYNLAVEQIALFQYPEAIASLRHAIRHSLAAQYPLGRALSANSLAHLLTKYGRIDEGLALADSAVATCERLDQPYYLAVALNTRAAIANELGRHAASLADLERALAEFRAGGYEASGDMIRTNRIDALVSLGRTDDVVQQARAVLDEFHDRKPENELIARTVLGRALWYTGRTEEALVELRAVTKSFHALQDTLEGPVSAADAARAVSAATCLALALLATDRTEAAWDVVEQSLGRQLRRRTGAQQATIDLQRFRSALVERGAIALVYGIPTVEGCPVFLVRENRIEAFEIDDVVTLRRASGEFAELLAAGSEGERVRTLGAELAELVFGPFGPVLRAAKERLVVVPGGLAGLNFGALPLLDDALLGEHLAVSFAPSATAFVELERRNPSTAGFFAFADPGASDDARWGAWAERVRSVANVALPHAREEIRAIAPVAATLFEGEHATTAAFRSAAARARVLHVATHAIVDAAHPATSALLLAATSEEDGLLLASEIAGLRLDADLVCLSACATAGGYLSPSEGAFGLTRAFLVAGARTVVSTWWDVDDAAARRFMEHFYAALRAGHARDEAARRARVALRDEGHRLRDRVAFAVVGAVSGSLDDVLGPGAPARRSFDPRVLVVLLAATGAILLIVRARRGRSPHP
jgi:CHAT domain-containing protein